MKQPITVAIIGGGYSGTLTAIHLLHSKPAGALRIVMIDRSLSRRKEAEAQTNEKERSNTPRRIYRDYIDHLFQEALQRRSGNVSIERINSEAVSLVANASETSAVITLRNGRDVIADKVVLALGSLSKRRTDYNSVRSERERNSEYKGLYKHLDRLVSELRSRLLIRVSWDRSTIETQNGYNVVDATGKASPLLYAIGSLRQPTSWGNMALKAVYLEAAQLASQLAGQPECFQPPLPEKLTTPVSASPWPLQIPAVPTAAYFS